MMVKQKLQKVFAYLINMPKRYYVIALVVLLVLAYAWVFFVPKSVALNYGGPTCVNHLTLFPTIHKTIDTSKYTISPAKIYKVGSVPVLSLKACFSPESTPVKGRVVVASAPWGSIIARRHFAINVSSLPLVDGAINKKAIPANKPLRIPLTKTDALFSYRLIASDKTADCSADGKNLVCDLPSLDLEQGKTYPVSLHRHFNNKDTTKLQQKTIQTLKATTVSEASLKNEETIFDKRKEFTYTMNKPVKSVKATLQAIGAGGEKQEIAVTATAKENIITISVENELEREKSYNLVLDEVEGVDGSSLLEPLTTKFTMSGGPKVASINIGKTRVDRSSKVILTFDQALSPTADINKFITLTGGVGTITKLSDTKVGISLQSLPLCTNFTVTVKEGLTSSFEIPAKTSWAHQARIICHSVGTIGISREGRPITAYYFGSGPTTLFIGALHGNEVSSSLILKDWIEELENNAPELTAGRQIVVVPTVNPDGLARRTRNNANNVNLNRNFPTNNWQRDINDTNGHVKNGGGSEPLSEPEAKALANLSTSLRPRLMLSYHAVGSVVIGDSGGVSAPYAAKYASMVGYRNGTGQGADIFDYSITGAYEEWTIQKAGIPSIVVELGSYTSRNFSHHRNAFRAMLQ